MHYQELDCFKAAIKNNPELTISDLYKGLNHAFQFDGPLFSISVLYQYHAKMINGKLVYCIDFYDFHFIDCADASVLKDFQFSNFSMMPGLIDSTVPGFFRYFQRCIDNVKNSLEEFVNPNVIKKTSPLNSRNLSVRPFQYDLFGDQFIFECQVYVTERDLLRTYLIYIENVRKRGCNLFEKDVHKLSFLIGQSIYDVYNIDQINAHETEKEFIHNELEEFIDKKLKEKYFNETVS